MSELSAVSPAALRAVDPRPSGNETKVPSITLFFWIIKVLCTTVGETASDFLNVNLGLGLVGTAIAAGLALAIALVCQFKADRYVPGIYWLTVVLISVFGTLVTDILTDSIGFPLEASTIIFSVALALTFAAWYAKEGTLAIHSIFTARRESFYWLAILFTFALGTASGDLMAEKLGLGYLVTGLIVLGVIAAATIGRRLGLDEVLSFWLAYILTRPLGASLGDYLSQSQANGGLGLGATITSVVFLAAILAVVVFLAITKRDALAAQSREIVPNRNSGGVIWQVVAVVGLLLIASGAGYSVRTSQLRSRAAASVSASAPLGDLSAFKKIAQDMLQLVRAGDAAGARARADDLETAWDNAQALMRPMNPEKWTKMDGAIDDVLRKVRAQQHSAADCVASLGAFVHVMDTLAKQPGAVLPHVESTAAATRPLGDLSAFRTITEDLVRLERSRDAAQSKARARDLETAWDENQTRLQPMSPDKWTLMDSAIDDVLKKARAARPNADESAASAQALLTVIDTLDTRN